uniref:Phospholipase B-like n=1 Tax=Parascaris equorum TaxID=6256 RepID=A0A914S438_PAREQ
MHLQNTVFNYCKGAQEYCERLSIFLLKNFLWMKAKIRTNPDDAYWKQNQVASRVISHHQMPQSGTERLGTNVDKENVEKEIDGSEKALNNLYPASSVAGFIPNMLQLAGDVEDLEAKFKRPPHLISRAFGSGHCSALIKLLDSNEDLLFSHVTWTSYSRMLKMQKRYSFKVGRSTNPGHTVTLSGYPGTLASNEDFVLTSAKLAILETTISNYNESSFKFITSTSVLTWIRSQWSIIDYKKFSPHKPLRSTGLLHVLEQLPGLIKHSDLTHVLIEQKYWASYNVPYFSSIFNRSGSWKFVEKFGDWFTYERNPRALIFARDQSTVADMKTLRKLMRSATNFSLMATQLFEGISGPTYNPLPIFDWNTTPLKEN